MTKTPRLSKVQRRFFDENMPAFLVWVEQAGAAIGVKLDSWNKRTIESLIRKDLITPDGVITASGRRAWERRRKVAA